jgi:HEAT repeat protein
VAPKRWIRAAILLASSAALPKALVRAQVAPPLINPTGADAPVDPATLADRNVAALDSQLIDDSPTSGQRDENANEQRREEAARRLLSRRLGHENLLEALKKSPNARLAIARAVAEDPQPDPAFIDPLLTLLGGDRALNDAAARAVARFANNPDKRAANVLPTLLDYAQRVDFPVNLRVGVIRALGGVVDKKVAIALVSLLADPKQNSAIQNAAGDALIEMTGLTANGHDSNQWLAWRAANDAKPDVAWRADVLAARDARDSRESRVQSDFANELKQILNEQYEQADKETKFAIVMRLLNSPDPKARVLGVQKVADAHDNANPFPLKAPERLINMIGDSDVNVRIAAARVIRSLNRIDALDAILAQLPQETDPDAKEAQVGALVPMKRLRALPALRQILNNPDEPLKVVVAAVEAIRELGPAVQTQNLDLALQVAAELLKIGVQRAGEAGGIAFRASTIRAVGALHLHIRAVLLDLLRLLNDPDERIRSAALNALGEIGDHDASFQIGQLLVQNNEPSPAVRIDALDALGRTSKFEDAADTLHKFMLPRDEPDKSVREKAWNAFQDKLGDAKNIEVLNRWASEFQNEPEHRLPVLIALNKLLALDVRWEELAISRQNTGETYMQLGDPAKAAIEFQTALDYWQKRPVANPVTAQLVRQLMESLLASRQYAAAAAFASRQIARDPTQQTILGPMLRDEVERLHDVAIHDNDPQKLNGALRLIDAVLKMQPPLVDRFSDDIRRFQQDIQGRMKK